MAVLRILGPALVTALGMLAVQGAARADRLTAQRDDATETGTSAVEELSYEVIVHERGAPATAVHLRIALHNGSAVRRDAVHVLALPRGAVLHDVALAEDGQWSGAHATVLGTRPGRRDPGTLFVRRLEPENARGLPTAEIVAFGLEPGATLQVELRLAVHPRLRGTRWELVLPRRGPDRLALASERRVLVKDDAGAAVPFSVDEVENAGRPYMSSRPADEVVVSWPARTVRGESLQGSLELEGERDGRGRFRLQLRLGQAPPLRPEHVIVLLDRSQSTAPTLQREALRMLERLFDTLPPSATFELVAFARRPVALLGGPATSVRDPEARLALRHALDANPREQGTDLKAALSLLAERVPQGARRRTVAIVVTDGMLPSTSLGPALAGALDRRRIDTVFVVDDPLLLGSGLPSDHPIVRVAGELGARIGLRSLSDPRATDPEALLSAPPVLGELDLGLGDRVEVDRPLPGGVVGGSSIVVEGTYRGRAPSRIHVRGRLGHRKLHKTLPARSRPASTLAFALATRDADPRRARDEGFVLPDWYGPDDARAARLGVDQAGRGGAELRGRLDETIFRHYLRIRVLPRATVCYNHALARDQVLRGRVMLEIEVGKGEVMAAGATATELSAPDDKLVACLTEAAWQLDIPAGKLDDRVYRLRYPLRLMPPKDGRARPVDDPLGEGTVELLLGGGIPSAG